MSEVSEFLSINSDGTASLADGRTVRLVAGRHNMIGYRDVDQVGAGPTAVDVIGLDQLGKTPVPTMREALSG